MSKGGNSSVILLLLCALVSVMLAATPGFGASRRDRADCDKVTEETAMAACERVINDRRESKRNRSDAFVNRGLLRFGTRDFDPAIADFTEAIRLNPKNARAYQGRGAAWLLKKEIDRAIADFGVAIRLDPKYAESYHSRGTLGWSRRTSAVTLPTTTAPSLISTQRSGSMANSPRLTTAALPFGRFGETTIAPSPS